MSSVMVMLLWPSHCCTTFGGNSRPPRSFGLMHQLAKKCRKACGPYFGLPCLSTTCAAVKIVSSLRLKLRSLITVPMLDGNTRPSSPFGHATFHTLNASARSAPNGTVRQPLSDLGDPISPKRSARCRTCSSLDFRSTSDQRRPRVLPSARCGQPRITHERGCSGATIGLGIERVACRHGVRLLLRNAGECGANNYRVHAVLMTKCRDQHRWIVAGSIKQWRFWTRQRWVLYSSALHAQSECNARQILQPGNCIGDHLDALEIELAKQINDYRLRK